MFLGAFDGFPLKLQRYPSDMLILIRIVWKAIEVNVLSKSLKKKGYEFPMKLGDFSYDTHSDAKNMLKVFEMKYKLDMYEVLRPMFDPNGYAWDVLQIGTVIKHITRIKDYSIDCKDEFKSHDQAFTRLIVDQVKM